MPLAVGEGGGVCPRVAAVPKSQSELIPERSGYGDCDSGVISSMTPSGRNKTVSIIPFLVGSTVASILVLAVVVAIVIAGSGGSDVAEPHWPLAQDPPWRATFTPAALQLPPLLEREAAIFAYASCGGRYSGDERRARAETATANLDQGRRTVGEFKAIISIECPPAWVTTMGDQNWALPARTRDLAWGDRALVVGPFG